MSFYTDWTTDHLHLTTEFDTSDRLADPDFLWLIIVIIIIFPADNATREEEKLVMKLFQNVIKSIILRSLLISFKI